MYRTCTHLDLIFIREQGTSGPSTQRSVDEQCYVLPGPAPFDWFNGAAGSGT